MEANGSAVRSVMTEMHEIEFEHLQIKGEGQWQGYLITVWCPSEGGPQDQARSVGKRGSEHNKTMSYMKLAPILSIL